MVMQTELIPGVKTTTKNTQGTLIPISNTRTEEFHSAQINALLKAIFL